MGYVLILATAAGIGTLLGACEPAQFMCQSDASCGSGICASGYCAFSDDACSSGHRYSPHAAVGLANQCVSRDEPETQSGTEDADDVGGSTSGSGASGGDNSDADESGGSGRPTVDEAPSPEGTSSGGESESSSDTGVPNDCAAASCLECLECASEPTQSCGASMAACEADGESCQQGLICMTSCALADECQTECCAGLPSDSAALAIAAYACLVDSCHASGCIDVDATCNAG